MKNLTFAAIALLFATTLLAGGQCPSANLIEHGTVQAGVEGNCWVFVTDSGATYQMMGGPNSIYADGLTGVLTGTVNPDIFTTCMQGPVVGVCSFDADDTVNVVGTLRYASVEGGCWVLDAGNRSYLALSEEVGFYVEGARVKVSAIERDDIRTYCMVGGVLQVLGFEFLNGGHNGSDAVAAASCHSAYAHCTKLSRDNYTLVACETIFNGCVASN